MNRARIAIVGAGFSGVLTALRILESGRDRVHVTLFEKSSHFGRGLAYETHDQFHLLNVPAGKMSAFPEEPGHFLKWLQENGHAETQATDFVPRIWFRDYIQSFLKRARAFGDAFQEVPEELIAVETAQPDGTASELTLQTRGGKQFIANHVVLALGNFAPSYFATQYSDLSENPHYINLFWNNPRWTDIHPESDVLILGTGLSMIDASISLLKRNHKGQISAISRRGFRIQSHPTPLPQAVSYNSVSVFPKGLRQLFSFVRKEIASEESQGRTWHGVIDGLRPWTNTLWQNLSLEDKSRFLRHLRIYWDTHRHRSAPDITRCIQSAIETGKIKIIRGRIQNIQNHSGRFKVSVASHNPSTQNSELLELMPEFLVDCSGTEMNARKFDSPIIKSLVKKGWISLDPLSMGLDVNPQGHLLHPRIWAIGPMRKGVLWETTAVPELKEQAKTLAENLVATLE